MNLKILLVVFLGALLTGALGMHGWMSTKIDNIHMTHLSESLAALTASTHKIQKTEHELQIAQDDLSNNLRKHQDEIDSVRRIGVNDLRLRDNRAVCSDTVPADTDGVSGDNGGSGAELSREVVRDLWNLVSDSDKVARQLESCQQWVQEITQRINQP